MQPLIVTERNALEHAFALLESHGTAACGEAAARADRSRDLGNVLHFCRWRHIERLIRLLSREEAMGTVH